MVICSLKEKKKSVTCDITLIYENFQERIFVILLDLLSLLCKSKLYKQTQQVRLNTGWISQIRKTNIKKRSSSSSSNIIKQTGPPFCRKTLHTCNKINKHNKHWRQTANSTIKQQRDLPSFFSLSLIYYSILFQQNPKK